jgi:hypothetical protein
VKIDNKNISDLTSIPIDQVLEFSENIDSHISDFDRQAAEHACSSKSITASGLWWTSVWAIHPSTGV